MRQRKLPRKSVGLTVGYIRVSSDDQAENGASLDCQEARVRAYAEAMDLPLHEVIADAGVSAKTLQRPGMTRILAGVRDGSIVRVIALKLDRYTRSIRDLDSILELFKEHKASLVSVSDQLDTKTASGRLIVNMLGSVAQWEREIIAERTSDVLADKRQKGQVYGSTPFGYRRDGKQLLPDEFEQNALQEALRMDRAESSFREIGRMLTERGARPKRAAVWHASSVRAMLRSRIVTEASA
ncbi:MAG TPA: recombinase family protein [Candidatus Tumulicola sp.]|jgi:DNA invertase Pin-like site-specific DNA recombinase